MSFSDIIKQSVIEGFNYSDMSTTKMIIVLLATFLMALYIFFIYRYVTRSTFYNKSFGISLCLISVVTGGIVLAMQSNLVISLGMVGALSIVRFRTAIKEPMDLFFLFWSIGTGIISGAGLFELAIIEAVVVTVGLLALQLIPATASPEVLVLKLSDVKVENEVMGIVDECTLKHKVDSKSITRGQMNLIIEVTSISDSAMVNRISEVEGVISATLMKHEGEIKN